MKYLFLIPTILLFNICIAQSLSISKQIANGGLSSDDGVSMGELDNGNIVICAHSWSGISGDKTEIAYGKTDYWIYEIQPNGTIVWQKTIGGTGYDTPSSMIQTMDEGFLIVGNSNSPISGNKTSANFGGYDVWVVKISATGNLEWQKSYGGVQGDFGMNLLEVSSNKIIIAATSSSVIGGNKTVAPKGGSDYWIIHIDQQGTIVNQYVYGGASDDAVQGIGIWNNQLIFSGSSYSDNSGDKLENSYGSADYWIIKTDLNGVIIHSKTIGGDNYESNPSLGVNPDGSITLYGFSRSPISGIKTSSNYGLDDLWVVKLDNNLNYIWDTSLGGSNQEDGGVSGISFSSYNNANIVLGTSKSSASGNKLSDSFGEEDYWIVGLDTNGNKKFEFEAGGLAQERSSMIIESSRGTIFVLGKSFSDISGNKTLASAGSADVWLIELDFNLSVKTIRNNLKLDVFPVPSSTYLNFSIPMKGVTSNISLINIMGSVVLSKTNTNGESESIDVSNLPKGTYILKVVSPSFHYWNTVIIN